MHIPQHWARAHGKVPSGDLQGHSLAVWGWSSESRADASEHAQLRLQETLARIARTGELPHGYGYGDRPLREEQIDTVAGPDGETLGILTRNSVGNLVLNTDRALFLDIDDPPEDGGGFLGLFRRKKPSPPELGPELRAGLETLGLDLRLYRTKAGWRILATDRVVAPDDPIAKSALALPQVDPAYRNLCHSQQSFRARLQPKPWRCGMLPPPSRFPFEGPGERQHFERWLVQYEAAARAFATCRLVEHIGRGRIAPELQEIVDLHDEHCLIESDLPLA